MPQIEVIFDIDANGILHVSAKDKATGKEQSIVIKASSGLSDEEIDAMVRDAEANAEEDKKFEELIAARNTADGLIHSVKKTMEEAEISDEEKTAIEAAISDLEAAIKTDDKADIEAKTEVLSQASAKMAEQMYAKAQADADAGKAGAQAEQPKSDTGKDDDVVDAEFEEVDDKK
jgi:molecular chaperone DnaK